MAVKDRDAEAPGSLASMRRHLTNIVPMLPALRLPRWLLPWQTIRSAVLGGLVLGAATVPAAAQGTMAPEITIGVSMPPQLEPVVQALFEAELHAHFGIPETHGVVAVIPIGYPEGKFGPISRTPARFKTHFNRWGGFRSGLAEPTS